jgi:hypothetical protein
MPIILLISMLFDDDDNDDNGVKHQPIFKGLGFMAMLQVVMGSIFP